MCKTAKVKLYIFWRDIKEDLNEGDELYLWVGWVSIVKLLILPELTCGVNGLFNQNPAWFFLGWTWQAYLKMYVVMQKDKIKGIVLQCSARYQDFI